MKMHSVLKYDQPVTRYPGNLIAFLHETDQATCNGTNFYVFSSDPISLLRLGIRTYDLRKSVVRKPDLFSHFGKMLT